jgi:hypothetical protein
VFLKLNVDGGMVTGHVCWEDVMTDEDVARVLEEMPGHGRG